MESQASSWVHYFWEECAQEEVWFITIEENMGATDEKGHYSKDCPRNKGSSNKNSYKKRHHAHTAKDYELAKKRFREERVDSSSDEEYVLISASMGTITHGSNDWLVDSGASKHMTEYKESFVDLSKHESPHKVKLGDDYQYPIKGSGEASYKLDSNKSLKMKDVLYVPGLKKSLLSISMQKE